MFSYRMEQRDVASAASRHSHTQPLRGLSLFWRTFIMIGMLLTTSAVGWLMTVRSVDLEPRATQTAQQIASLVNLSRAALVYSDSITRYALIKTLADDTSVKHHDSAHRNLTSRATSLGKR